MKVRVGLIRKLVREATSPTKQFMFSVYGPDSEEYTVSAVYDRRMPYEVEIISVTDQTGVEIEPKAIDSMGIDLHAAAMDYVGENMDDPDPPQPL